MCIASRFLAHCTRGAHESTRVHNDPGSDHEANGQLRLEKETNCKCDDKKCKVVGTILPDRRLKVLQCLCFDCALPRYFGDAPRLFMLASSAWSARVFPPHQW